MIPEKVSEGRMGLIKRVRPISRDDDRPVASWFSGPFERTLCMNIDVLLILHSFAILSFEFSTKKLHKKI